MRMFTSKVEIVHKMTIDQLHMGKCHEAIMIVHFILKIHHCIMSVNLIKYFLGAN
jgi:hypothetical protein